MARVVAASGDGPDIGSPHTIYALNLEQHVKVHLSRESLTAVEEEAGTWCLYVNPMSNKVRGEAGAGTDTSQNTTTEIQLQGLGSNTAGKIMKLVRSGDSNY